MSRRFDSPMGSALSGRASNLAFWLAWAVAGLGVGVPASGIVSGGSAAQILIGSLTLVLGVVATLGALWFRRAHLEAVLHGAQDSDDSHDDR